MRGNKRLGDAELEIMLAVWAQDGPITSVQVREKLQESRGWAMATVMTSLHRLVEKGFLSVSKASGINTYTALIEEEAYKSQEGRNLLEKLYGFSMPKLVTNLYGSHVIGKEDLDALRELLDSLDGGDLS